MALFSALRKIGRTRFDLSLRVDTDGRRTNMGLLRFLWEIVLTVRGRLPVCSSVAVARPSATRFFGSS